jgi:F-type H+-transporting ATPase subunit a
MADPILHIKDAYFFEFPKFLLERKFKTKEDVYSVSPTWVELDNQYQDLEFHEQYHALEDLGVKLPGEATAHDDWHGWAHGNAANHGKPFDEFLKFKYDTKVAEFQAFKSKQVNAAKALPADRRGEKLRDANSLTLESYLKSPDNHVEPYDSFVLKNADSVFSGSLTSLGAWGEKKAEIAEKSVKEFVASDKPEHQWNAKKLEGYSKNLSGKVMIPQVFGGRLRNLHERESGLTISKYTIIEIGVALVIAIVFSWLARRVLTGLAPQGRAWNFLETFVVFIRKEIAEPAIGGGHHDEHHDEAHGEHHVEHGHKVDSAGHAVAHAAAHDHHGHDDHGHAHKPGKKHQAHVSPATKFTPLLCTIFFFVLGCNLAGMLPWMGAPTSAWGVTFAMACVTLGTVFVAGMVQFGFLGFFINQVPTMDMPWYMAMVLKPAIFVIEFGGLLIKHAVLSVRLLANMVAGHLVLLAILGLAFGAHAAADFMTPTGLNPLWWVTASAAVIGCTLLSLLELFVAFLQAYVFTLLSALFIGAAIHKH